MTVLAKLVFLFFKSVHTLFFFLTCSLIDRCQMVTDTCKDNVSKFVWKPFKSPLSLRKWKCFGEASLFNLHHLYFINTIYSLKNCSVYGRSYCIYSPKSFRFFRKEFHYVRKINKYINYLLRVGLFETSVTVFHHKVLCGHISVPSYEKLWPLRNRSYPRTNVQACFCTK